MNQTTITEALAELKVLTKRIAAKRAFIGSNTMRMQMLRDPLERDGGSEAVIQQELQSLHDLEENIVAIRRGIQIANETTYISLGREERTIADWLIWRREVAPGRLQFIRSLRAGIAQHRAEALKQGKTVSTEPSADVVVNLDERALATQDENLEAILESLDGQLSLKNATTLVEW